MKQIIKLENNLAIYKVHIDDLKEQDKNARVMSAAKFDRLTANIKKDKRLESLPLCTITQDRGGNERMEIISGHHRVRSARKAEVNEIYVIVDEQELSRDQIKAKQLAHNSLTGEDDPQILEELYNEIADVTAKIESGVTDKDLNMDVTDQINDIKMELDFELVSILFLPDQLKEFDRLLDFISKDKKIYLADKRLFRKYKKMIRKVSQVEEVRNITAIMDKIIRIVNDYYQKQASQSNNKEGQKKKGN